MPEHIRCVRVGMRDAAAAPGTPRVQGVSQAELNVRGIVVSFREAADKYARIGDEAGLEDCRRRALMLLDELEARLEPEEQARLRQVADEARDGIMRYTTA
jgi:hypothetical protein